MLFPHGGGYKRRVPAQRPAPVGPPLGNDCATPLSRPLRPPPYLQGKAEQPFAKDSLKYTRGQRPTNPPTRTSQENVHVRAHTSVGALKAVLETCA